MLQELRRFVERKRKNMEHDVIIYYANVNPLALEDVFSDKMKNVNKQRRNKILRCSHKIDQMRSLGAGLLLRYALEKQGLTYDDLQFGIDENGKGYLEDHKEVHYSITHGGDYVAVAIANTPIGVDIESIERFCGERGNKTIERVAKYAFSQEEIARLYDAQSFARIWTRKEAYTKAIGCGIATDLKLVDTQSDGFYSTVLEENYMCSVYSNVVSDKKEPINLVAIDFKK